MRQTGDYDDLFDWTEEDITPLFPKVDSLIRKLKLHVNKQNKQ